MLSHKERWLRLFTIVVQHITHHECYRAPKGASAMDAAFGDE